MAKKKNADIMSTIIKDIQKNKSVTVLDAPDVIEGISSGSLVVDLALGGNGFPRGAITEIYGPNNTGKTTLSLMMLREAMWEAHERDMYCFYVNAEKRPLDGKWYKSLGLPYEQVTDTNTGELKWQCSLKDDNGNPRLIIVEAETAETTANVIMDLVGSGMFIAGVLDSVANLSPKAEVETDMNKNTQIGMQSRFMARWMRVFMDSVRKTQIALVFLNHYRVKIDAGMYENKGTSSGGNAFHHQSSIRLETYRMKDEWESDDVKEHIRMHIRFYIRKTSVTKNRGALISCTLEHDKESGTYLVDPALEAFSIAKEKGLFFSRDGSKWSGRGIACFDASRFGYNGDKEYDINDNGHYEIGGSHDDILDTLRSDVDMIVALEMAIRAYVNHSLQEVEEEPEVDEDELVEAIFE